MRRLLAVLLLAGFCPVLMAQDALRASAVGQPAGWADDLALTTLPDTNPDPNIYEIELEAKIVEMEIIPGTKTPVWTYGGSLPGPLIRVKVGDRIIVHLKNSLPEATSIHWHGLRLPNGMDGVPGFTQPPLAPGETFTYDYVAVDAGTFWYHPHINSAAQVGWGMYGSLVVEDPADPEVFGDELVLQLSDMSLDEKGQFLPADQGTGFGDLFGREGNVLLVNGKVMPELKVRQGKQQRWRVINSTRSRYFTLRYKRSPLVRLGGDNGLMAHTQTVDEIKLTPGERTDYVFTPPDAPGTTDVFKWYPTDRGFGTTFNRLSENIMTITTVDEPAVIPEQIPETLREIPLIDTTGAIEHTIELTIRITDDKQVVMGINGKHHDNAVPLMAKVGETHIWTIRNDTDFSHPFHLHGYFFQVLGREGFPEW